MTRIAQTTSTQRQDATTPAGVTEASLLVVFLVSTAIGALSGLLLSGSLNPVVLAIVAGFLGTIAAGIARNTLLIHAWGLAGVEDVGTPIIVIIYAAVASLAGSLAAHYITLLGDVAWPTLIGTLAGALSSVLFGLLIVTYRLEPRQCATQTRATSTLEAGAYGSNAP
jgi:hypothetical protein